MYIWDKNNKVYSNNHIILGDKWHIKSPDKLRAKFLFTKAIIFDKLLNAKVQLTCNFSNDQ